MRGGLVAVSPGPLVVQSASHAVLPSRRRSRRPYPVADCRAARGRGGRFFRAARGGGGGAGGRSGGLAGVAGGRVRRAAGARGAYLARLAGLDRAAAIRRGVAPG